MRHINQVVTYPNNNNINNNINDNNYNTNKKKKIIMLINVLRTRNNSSVIKTLIICKSNMSINLNNNEFKNQGI